MPYDHVSGRLSDLDKQVVDAVPPGGNWRNLPENFDSDRIRQIRVGAASGEGSRSTYYGRLTLGRPSYTISTFFNRPGNGCFIHPTAPRLITVREGARLQSFPDRFRFHGRGRARFLQVGNAVPPLLAYQLARVLKVGRVVDLFSGAGGLSLGFQHAGAEVLAAVDVDRAANTAYGLNIGHEALHCDLSDPSAYTQAIAEIRVRAGREGIGVLAGGPPCQGFSTAGSNRLDDPRNKLVFSFLRAVEDLRPEYALMENVPALLWRGRSQVVSQLRRQFHALGYETSVVVAHAEGYGVPQLRRRFFLLASRGAPLRWPRPSWAILEPAQIAHQPAPCPEQELRPPVTVGEAIGDLPLEEAGLPDSPVDYAGPPSCDYQRWARGEFPIDQLIPDPCAWVPPVTLFNWSTT